MSAIREILVLHHSHLDLGYTHSQPVVWEMHREYIDAALELLAGTADWPSQSRPKWTCEVTAPLLFWMRTAGEAQIERLRAFAQDGRLGISALQYNTTPLCSAELLSRQLAPVAELRRRLGVPIRTVNQHDVNGVPWPLADLLIDAGVELLTMAVNIDHGHFVRPRPGVFWWEAPSGRRLLVMNGAHYTMFDQQLRSWEDTIAAMREGLGEYRSWLSRQGYPHDFLYLTSTNPPEAWDNSPPNPRVAGLVRRWNENGGDPPIRYVTPEDLLERLQTLDTSALPVLRGDWTDYWSFGSGSTAYETALSRRARFNLATAELIAAGGVGGADRTPAARRASDEAWENAARYAEHTWSYWDPDPWNPPTRAQSTLKAGFAHTARELASYVLTSELEALAANPAQSAAPDHVLLVNPSPCSRTEVVHVPSSWMKPGRTLRSVRFTWQEQEGRRDCIACGPVELPPFGWTAVPLSTLTPAARPAGLGSLQQGSSGVLRSPFHELTYDTASGRVTGLVDTRLGWQLLPTSSPYAFFEFVHERPDPRFNGSREAIYRRDLEREKFDMHCWQTDWRAERRGPSRLISLEVREEAHAVSLVRQWEAPGVRRLRQTITLRADSAVIGLEALLDRDDRCDPDAIYFAFPLALPGHWSGLFDTAGIPVALDDDQLPGSCRGWMSVDTFVAVGSEERVACLLCPDSTLVQAGAFGFGRLLPAVARDKDPLILAWPMNNYWNTNFPLSQPGQTVLRWGFATSSRLHAPALMGLAQEYLNPPIVHPCLGPGTRAEGQFLLLEGDGILVDHVKPASDGRGIVVRLVNVTRDPVTARLGPGQKAATSAWICGSLEEDRQRIPVEEGKAVFVLPPLRLTLVRLQ